MNDGLDFYITPTYATYALLDREDFVSPVWEPACGTGEISKVLRATGHNVISTDIARRGYGIVEDFFASPRRAACIVTNPPYRLAEDFVRRALDRTTHTVAMLLPLSFLSSQRRFALYMETPLRVVYVFANRVSMYPAGERGDHGSGTTDYGWFVWQKGWRRRPEIDWLPPNAVKAG